MNKQDFSLSTLVRETSPGLGVPCILDGPFPSDREEEVRQALSGSGRREMGQGPAPQPLVWDVLRGQDPS